MPHKLTQQEAQTIGVEAYLYFYPLISMDVTRKQATNVEAGKIPGRGPANQFQHITAYPPADFKGVVRPNFDTLYSSAFLDLTRGPVVMSLPDTGGRYYLMPMLDMWTDVFASPGSRTTGTEAGTFLIAPSGWRADADLTAALPEGTQRIDAPTPYVWIIGRTRTDGPTDYGAVHEIQAGCRLTALADRGTPRPAQAKIDPDLDMTTPPKVTVDSMPADKYFAYAAELLKVVPPHSTDQPIVARLRKIGIEPGRSFNLGDADPVVRAALERAPADALKLMEWKLPTLARVVNGWSMNTDTMGVYGNYYLKRALVAQQGLGANVPEDAIYPLNLTDSGGKALDGASKYALRFDAGETPPCDAFWSITLYDDEGFPVANPLDRHALSSWMPFKTNADGSLDLHFQAESPGKDWESNWLPTPKTPFGLTMRIYAPRMEALAGKWSPPPVVRKES
jgi:hypothetical protein